MKKVILFLISCLFSYNIIQAQNKVSGVITDGAGNPLPDVSIRVKGASSKATSSSDGNYIIKVPSYKETIIFKLKGYLVQKVDISSEKVDVVMYKDILESLLELTLEELLQLKVTSAGKKEENISDIPASVEVVDRTDIETYGYSSLEEIIANITGYYTMDDLSYTLSLPGVRGFMSQNGTGVIILINGVSQLRKGLESYSLRESNVPVESIDRIEIIST